MAQPRTPGARNRRARRVALSLGICAAALAACAGSSLRLGSRSRDCDDSFYRSAGQEQLAYLERQVARLRADLNQAEESMVGIESGLRGIHTRADAVSALAEARIAVERASRAARWRPEQVKEARAKLEEAERQLQAGHSGSAVFFASRARRIAETLNEEAEHVARSTSTRFVNTRRVNLRSGPSTDHGVVDVLSEDTPVFPERQNGEWVLVRTLSGPAGWVHTELLRTR